MKRNEYEKDFSTIIFENDIVRKRYKKTAKQHVDQDWAKEEVALLKRLEKIDEPRIQAMPVRSHKKNEIVFPYMTNNLLYVYTHVGNFYHLGRFLKKFHARSTKEKQACVPHGDFTIRNILFGKKKIIVCDPYYDASRVAMDDVWKFVHSVFRLRNIHIGIGVKHILIRNFLQGYNSLGEKTSKEDLIIGIKTFEKELRENQNVSNLSFSSRVYFFFDTWYRSIAIFAMNIWL